MRFENVQVLEVGDVYPVLVSGDEHMVLIDTGFPLQFDDCILAIEKSGKDPNKLTHIIITHQDIDHIGNIKEFKAKYPQIIFMAHEEEVPYMNGQKTPIKVAKMEESLSNLSNEQQAFFTNFSQACINRRMAFDTLLRDHEVLDICGGIEVIHTPGHTPGHICLYIRTANVLVTGDAMNIDCGVLKGANPQYTYDMELAKKSLQKLEKFGVVNLVSYHGGVLTDVDMKLNFAL